MHDFVSQSAWGRALAPDRLARVLRSCREARFAPGEHAVRAGDAPRYWVGIIDGLIVQQVTNEEGKSAALTAACSGTWFGEGTLMKRVNWQYGRDREARDACRADARRHVRLAARQRLRVQPLPPDRTRVAYVRSER